MQGIHSFDIFDTIIGRRVQNPTDVFKIVEKNGVDNFFRNRLEAQSCSNNTWQSIYEQYAKITGLTSEECAMVQELELLAEESVIYLIHENATKVQPCDILISDMYLPSAAIRRLLTSAGFHLNIPLYATPAGKASGYIWNQLKDTYDITLHTGDNPYSDVESPRAHGLNAELTTLYKFNDYESAILARGYASAALAFRQFRLNMPTPVNKLGALQTDYNLILLVICANTLKNICKNENLENVLLCTRDGCLLEYVLPALCPELNVVRFHSSRVAYKFADLAYKTYLQSVYVPGKSIIFDLHGNFQTGRPLFMEVFGELPRVHCFDSPAYNLFAYPSFTCSATDIGNFIELVNADTVGTLQYMTSDMKDIRSPASYKLEPVLEAHTIVTQFAHFAVLHRDAFLELHPSVLSDVMRIIKRNNAIHTDLVTYKPALDDNYSLTDVANEFGTDKGNLHYCKHGYTKHYMQILSPYNSMNVINLLEIGLNRASSKSTPSLDMWNKYYGTRVRTVGFDINPEFLVHANERKTIIIGDQSNALDLQKCVAYGPYDIVIDDGWHASKHQQVTLANLWPMVRSGGVYIIEDLHYQPEPESVMKTKNLLLEWREGRTQSTDFIPLNLAESILSEISSVQCFDSHSPNPMWPPDTLKNALIAIYKK